MPVLSRIFMAIGAVMACAGGALSAAAAHVPALQMAGPALAASLNMQQWHALGLLVLGLTQARWPNRWWALSGGLMVLGLLLFCLNIDARILWGWEAARGLVPVGGSAFMLAWLALAVGVLRHPRALTL